MTKTISQTEFDAIINEKADLATRQEEVQKRKLEIEEHKTLNELNRINEVKRNQEVSKTIDFGMMSPELVKHLQDDNTDYFMAAKHMMPFINKAFDGIVPMFRKNLILIGALTGNGKSTTTANIIANAITNRNYMTGKRQRILVITNEEVSSDVYNRVTCLIKGWPYSDHGGFSDAQVEEFNKYIGILSQLVTVVDDTFGSTPENPVTGMTTTIEGIQTIFDNLIKQQHFYDIVIIDYYQKICKSSLNPSLDEYKVLSRVATMLDNYKNCYPAPIIIFSQLKHKDKKDDDTPFEFRVKGCKAICEKATFIMETEADWQNYRNRWLVQKSRFLEARGKDFHTGFDRGKIVEITDEFNKKINAYKEKKQWNETVGKYIKKEQEEKEKEDANNTEGSGSKQA